MCWIRYEEGNHLLPCTIYGKTDAAIAETATFFWSLEHAGESSNLIICGRVVDRELHFDLNALTPGHLARVLDANPKREFALEQRSWNAAQTVILATRPYPLNLTHTGTNFAVDDEGTSFADALERRHSSFGYLNIDFRSDKMPFSSSSLNRMLEIDVIEKLTTSVLPQDCVSLPFYTMVNALDCRLDTRCTQPEDFGALSVVTKDLTVRIDWENADD